MHKKKLVILLDGSYYLYKSYYGFMSLTSNTHKTSEAIYGILKIIRNILIQYAPHKLIIVFDSKKKNFRQKIFPEYKKNRIPIPKELKIQIPVIYKIIDDLGIPILSIPHVEADDVIGTLSVIAQKKGENVLIGTADKDFSQLVNEDVKIFNNINHTILGPKEIKKKYGVPPKLIIDLLSLMGDKTDNIPGIFGIGQKIATKLLLNIGCIIKIYKNINQILSLPIRNINNIFKKVKDGKNKAFLSYKLAKIKINVNLNQEYEKLIFLNKNKQIKYIYSKYQDLIIDIQKYIKNIK
ncbi:5'-3' exonuclease H3TH domain-containing protein [Buchnera aphidicola]|uniref:5'-3' exonuclease n=1 Tax=Buchnera aphidicola TaxID=9 RepID=UPI003464227B